MTASDHATPVSGGRPDRAPTTAPGSATAWAGWSSFIVRPSVALTIPWVGVCALLGVFRVAVMKFPVEPDAVLYLVSFAEFSAVSLVNGLLFLALLVEGGQAISSPRDLRRAHLTTVGMALILLVMFQVGVILAAAPVSVP